MSESPAHRPVTVADSATELDGPSRTASPSGERPLWSIEGSRGPAGPQSPGKHP
jgi:hypothetical protein